MSNVLVSPDLVTNLVSVRRLTHENPLSVEFDGVGFSVKDACTRMILHRCDSPDQLYPCTPAPPPPHQSPLPPALTFGTLAWVTPTTPSYVKSLGVLLLM